MELKDKIIVVTGAASGIGKAMAIRFAAEGAKCVVCADMNGAGAAETAAEIGGVSHQLNVGKEDEIKALIDKTESEQGPIDLFCSNAGISVAGGVECSNDEWQTIWGRKCHVSRLRCPPSDPSDERTRRRLSSQHVFRCWPAKSSRLRPLRSDQTRGCWLG